MKNIVPSARRQSEAIRRMVTAAMLSAITAVLTFTPIGMIPLPPPLLSATTVHLPVILAALVEGPVVGLVVGLVFGLCSFIRAWESGAVGLTLFFRNPLVSVLPRLLVPLVALGVYLLWKRFAPRGAVSDKVGAAVASAVGSIANTVLCLGMLLVIYGADLTQLINNMISAGQRGRCLSQRRRRMAGDRRRPAQRHRGGRRGRSDRADDQNCGRGGDAPFAPRPRPARPFGQVRSRPP